jgi:hypothetical protein
MLRFDFFVQILKCVQITNFLNFEICSNFEIRLNYEIHSNFDFRLNFGNFTNFEICSQLIFVQNL